MHSNHAPSCVRFFLQKHGGYIPNSLGGSSISVGRQAGSEMKIFAI